MQATANVACLSPNGTNEFAFTDLPDVLLAATLDGIVEIVRDGKTWSPRNRWLQGHHISCLTIEPATGTIVAGTHKSGVFRAASLGAEWQPCNAGLPVDNVFSVATAIFDGAPVILAGTEPPHFCRSYDLGKTWEESGNIPDTPGHETWDFPAPPHVAHVKHIDLSHDEPPRIFLSVEQGALLCSDDGGDTFYEVFYEDEDFIYNGDAHRVVFNRFRPGEAILTGGDGVVRTLDGGKTWNRIATPAMRVAYPDGIFYDPRDGEKLFVFGANGTPATWRASHRADAALVTTTNRGQTWEQVLDGLPPALVGNLEASTIFSTPAGFGFFAGTTQGEIFASFDDGIHWEIIVDELPSISKGGHYRHLVVAK